MQNRLSCLNPKEMCTEKKSAVKLQNLCDTVLASKQKDGCMYRVSPTMRLTEETVHDGLSATVTWISVNDQQHEKVLVLMFSC